MHAVQTVYVLVRARDLIFANCKTKMDTDIVKWTQGTVSLYLLLSLLGHNLLVGQATQPLTNALCTNKPVAGPKYIVLGIGVCVDAQHRRPLTFSCVGGPNAGVPFAAPCPSYSAASCADVCESVKGCTGKRSCLEAVPPC